MRFLLTLVLAIMACLLQDSVQIQTSFQRQYMQRLRKQANKLSSSATKLVLAALSDPLLRTELGSCCPTLANLSSAQLLERFRAQVRVSEAIHNFGAVAAPPSPPTPPNQHHHHQHGHSDVTLAILDRKRRFLNLWELMLLNQTAFNAMQPESASEVGLFGLPQFTANHHLSPDDGGGEIPWPASLAEAQQRPIYIALNLIKSDVGNIVFGDVAAVFRNKLALDSGCLVPMDTGLWEMHCNKSAFPPMQVASPATAAVAAPNKRRIGPSIEADCKMKGSGTTVPTLGTFDDFDHLILQSVTFWRGATNSSKPWQPLLAQLLGRMLAPESVQHIYVQNLMHYWEANLEALAQVPSDIKFLIGNYPALFGSPKGQVLRDFCQRHQLPLVWALGPGVPEGQVFGSNSTFVVRERLMDPLTVPPGFAANITVTRSALAAWNTSWAQVAAARLQNETHINNNVTFWVDAFDGTSAAGPSFFAIHPLNAGQCANVDACIGADVNGHCVCAHSL